MPEEFATLRRLLEARMGKQGKREFVQVLRLMEVFRADEAAAAVRDAITYRLLIIDELGYGAALTDRRRAVVRCTHNRALTTSAVKAVQRPKGLALMAARGGGAREYGRSSY
jgi:hypothetical protein